jgi:2-hydroxy-6-oxonona-2,4-dienedioate hydrolase
LIKYEFQYLKVDDLLIRYIDTQSKGKSVLLIHGLGGSIESWINNIGTLSTKQLRVIAVDLPGFGSSDKPQINYTINFYTKFVEKFINYLKISSPISIVGSSLGGHIAAEVAIKYYKIVYKLVLVSPAGVLPISFRGTPALLKYTTILKARTVQEVKRGLSSVDNNSVDESYAQIVYQKLSMPGAKEAFLSALRGSTRSPRLNRRLHKIKAETLLIWGKEDRIIPVKFIEPFIKMKNCRLLLLENCGHRPHIDKPEFFNSTIADFIND